MKKALTATVCLLFSLLCFADDAAEQIKLVKKAMAEQKFEIKIDMIYPQSGPAISADCSYSLQVADGKATSYLPFFGEAHSSMIAGVDETGIKFEEKPVKLDIKKKTGKKATTYEISFSVDCESDSYDFFLEIGDNGHANINCNCLKRSPMSYSGELVF